MIDTKAQDRLNSFENKINAMAIAEEADRCAMSDSIFNMQTYPNTMPYKLVHITPLNQNSRHHGPPNIDSFRTSPLELIDSIPNAHNKIQGPPIIKVYNLPETRNAPFTGNTQTPGLNERICSSREVNTGAEKNETNQGQLRKNNQHYRVDNFSAHLHPSLGYQQHEDVDLRNH